MFEFSIKQKTDENCGMCLAVVYCLFQLIQFLTKFALEEEGILRVPGSVTRIKVGKNRESVMLFISCHQDQVQL